MKTYLVSLAVLSIFLLSACGGNSQKDSNATSSAESEDVHACFEEYLNQMDKMLTKDDILKHYQGDFTQAELEYDTTSSPEYSSVVFSWKGDSDRTERIAFNGQDYGPKPYRIGIGSLHFYDADMEFPIKTFKHTYRTMTAEEKEKARKAIQKELNKETDDKQTKKTAKTVGGSITSQIKFDQIDGIGDAAAWDYMESCLKVLKGKAIFNVIVDVSDNHEEDVKLAKALAKEVLRKCD